MKSGEIYGKILLLRLVKDKIWLCECMCGNIMELTENEILTQGCSQACLTSRGEICVMDIFHKLNISYLTQVKFLDADFKFDFYLPQHRTIIECDGAQHFRTKNSDWNSPYKLQETRERDLAKQEYCRTHNLKLYQIPFWDYNKLNENYLRSIL